MQEITQLQNMELLYTNLCRECEYCIIHNKKTECEWDMFVPVCSTKAELYTSVDFDCINFHKR